MWNFLICPRSNCDGNWFRFLLPSAPRAQHAPLLSTSPTPLPPTPHPLPSFVLLPTVASASTTMANYSNNSCHYYYSSCCCCVLCFAICRKISLPLLLSAFNTTHFSLGKRNRGDGVERKEEEGRRKGRARGRERRLGKREKKKTI